MEWNNSYQVLTNCCVVLIPFCVGKQTCLSFFNVIKMLPTIICKALLNAIFHTWYDSKLIVTKSEGGWDQGIMKLLVFFTVNGLMNCNHSPHSDPWLLFKGPTSLLPLTFSASWKECSSSKAPRRHFQPLKNNFCTILEILDILLNIFLGENCSLFGEWKKYLRGEIPYIFFIVQVGNWLHLPINHT